MVASKLHPAVFYKEDKKVEDEDLDFDSSPKIQIEESPNEPVADGLILIERGQYVCQKCNSIIGEYRVFKKGQ